MKKLALITTFLISTLGFSQTIISAAETPTPLANNTMVMVHENRRAQSVQVQDLRDFLKTYFDTIYGASTANVFEKELVDAENIDELINLLHNEAKVI